MKLNVFITWTFSTPMNKFSLVHVKHVPNKGRKQSNFIQWIIQNLHIVSDYIETFLHYISDKYNYCYILLYSIYIYIYSKVLLIQYMHTSLKLFFSCFVIHTHRHASSSTHLTGRLFRSSRASLNLTEGAAVNRKSSSLCFLSAEHQRAWSCE